MELTNYQEGFFQYLYALVKTYGKVYACENGKVFRNINSARQQEYDYQERRKYKLLWAEITMDNLPLNNEDFKAVLESYTPPEPKNSATKSIDTINIDYTISDEFNALKEARKNLKNKTKGRPPKEQ